MKKQIMMVLLACALVFVPVMASAVSVNPGLLNLTLSSYAMVYTLDSSKRYYGGYASYYDGNPNHIYGSLYTNSSLTSPRPYSSWTGENDEIWLTGVGVNSNNVAYARISYPIDGGGRVTAYMRLNLLIAGTEAGSSRTATSKYYGLYRRKNDGAVHDEYGIDPGDKVYLLAKSDAWCQVLYQVGSKWRIAWLPESAYNGLFPDPDDAETPSTSVAGNDSVARQKAVDYAYEMLNYTWTTNKQIICRGSSGKDTGLCYRNHKGSSLRAVWHSILVRGI